MSRFHLRTETGSETETRSFHWTHLGRFYLKMETGSEPETSSFYWVQISKFHLRTETGSETDSFGYGERVALFNGPISVNPPEDRDTFGDRLAISIGQSD
jgi:hypothetical protein